MSDLSYISESLRFLAEPIEGLTPDPANARKHDRKNLDAIRSSFERFGMVKPIAVRKADGVVVAGNGRLKVARELGWTHVAVVRMDGTPAQLTAFALADNKTAELAEWDDLALADAMRVAGEAAVDLSGLGWSAKDLDALLDGDDPLPPPEVLPDAEEPPAPQPPAAKVPPKGAAHAKAPAAPPSGRPAGVSDDEWDAVQAGAAAVREDRDEAGLTLGACLRIMARRYLKTRVQ